MSSLALVLRFGGWRGPAVPDERRRSFESPFGNMEKDTLLQTPGGLQDHVAWIQKDLEVQTDMWVPKRMCAGVCQSTLSLLLHSCPALTYIVFCLSVWMLMNVSQKLLQRFLPQIHIYKHKRGKINAYNLNKVAYNMYRQYNINVFDSEIILLYLIWKLKVLGL